MANLRLLLAFPKSAATTDIITVYEKLTKSVSHAKLTNIDRVRFRCYAIYCRPLSALNSVLQCMVTKHVANYEQSQFKVRFDEKKCVIIAIFM